MADKVWEILMKIKFVGFDPGGRKKFGWCVLTMEDGHETIKSGVVDDAEAAIEKVDDELDGVVPRCVGIDAPLYWISRGDRKADQAVREMYFSSKGVPGLKNEHLKATKVLAVNSLRGACLVQGLLVANMCMERWDSAEITECHPKALLHVSMAARDFVERSGMVEIDGDDDDERDAALAAFAAYFGREENKWEDLLKKEEQRPIFPLGLKDVHYWFPSLDNEKT